MEKSRFRRGGLLGAAYFVFFGGTVFGLQIEEIRSHWLGQAEQTPAVASAAFSATKSGDVIEKSLTLDFPSLKASEIRTDQGNFTRFSIPGAGESTAAGHPELPVYRQELLLDPNGSYECRVTILDEQSWLLR